MEPSTVLKVVFWLTLCCRRGAWSTTTDAPYAVGDIVQITSTRGSEFVDSMTNTLGKIGRMGSTTDRVDICDDYWYYNSDSLTKLASATASSLPKLSSGCIVSGATVTMKKEFIRGVMTLTCTIHNNPEDTHVRWYKGSTDITTGAEPRVRIHFDKSLDDSVLQILRITPGDLGWYTCEVRNESGLLATGALEIERLEDEPRSPQKNII